MANRFEYTGRLADWGTPLGQAAINAAEAYVQYQKDKEAREQKFLAFTDVGISNDISQFKQNELRDEYSGLRNRWTDYFVNKKGRMGIQDWAKISDEKQQFQGKINDAMLIEQIRKRDSDLIKNQPYRYNKDYFNNKVNDWITKGIKPEDNTFLRLDVNLDKDLNEAFKNLAPDETSISVEEMELPNIRGKKGIYEKVLNGTPEQRTSATIELYSKDKAYRDAYKEKYEREITNPIDKEQYEDMARNSSVNYGIEMTPELAYMITKGNSGYGVNLKLKEISEYIPRPNSSNKKIQDILSTTTEYRFPRKDESEYVLTNAVNLTSALGRPLTGIKLSGDVIDISTGRKMTDEEKMDIEQSLDNNSQLIIDKSGKGIIRSKRTIERMGHNIKEPIELGIDLKANVDALKRYGLNTDNPFFNFSDNDFNPEEKRKINITATTQSDIFDRVSVGGKDRDVVRLEYQNGSDNVTIYYNMDGTVKSAIVPVGKYPVSKYIKNKKYKKDYID